MTHRKQTVAKVAFIVVGVLTLAAVIYIMIKQLGLNPDLDFGAGAYYYADIPDYEKRIDWNLYETRVPYWVHVVLFLVWGVLMYLLWKWIDRKK